MKSLIVAAMLFPATLHAQKIKVPNKTNAIILRGISKTQIKDSLSKAGFTVISKDSTHFQTLPRQYKILDHGSLIIFIEASDTAMIMTGAVDQIANDALLNPYGNRYVWVRKTALGTPYGEAFEIMKQFAMAQPGKIYFAKRQLGRFSAQ